MRVISLVPSWTETLIETGVDVVGRTRYCVHPRERIRGILPVGGTKSLDWALVQSLNADLLLLDREENPRDIADASPLPWHATHVTGVADMGRELRQLASLFSNKALVEYAERWGKIVAHAPVPLADNEKLKHLPGVIDWISPPNKHISAVLYLIWKDPWMAVSRETFIGSVLTQVGFGALLPDFTEKYPKIDLATFDPATTLLLCSSEPYKFGKIRHEIAALGYPAALVDGECFSWFGIRSLRFLEAYKVGL